MDKLQTLATMYQASKLIYDGCPLPDAATSPDERIRLDMTRRVALKRLIKAENEYNAALDVEAERLASEHTSIGMAAE